ncbi:pEARLI1-like lipid transfer protein 2 [Ananas comosus]|uniref:PEARLI1-like lipid transfer protein 2 n=1 Tax=Ananas comosus TaxID=4615 RepID=A0A199UEW6_ANACO|nr:pEARLI1-like lipid transfer protein 2 [Ananas comosus]
MASKSQASAALFLALNLLLFALAAACGCGPTPKPPSPTPIPPTPYTPTPPTPYTPPIVKCPIDTLKLGACANLLNGLINFELGKPPKKPCCSLLGGLADAEVALCLCTVLSNVLGINLNIPSTSPARQLLCKNVPPGFQCP